MPLPERLLAVDPSIAKPGAALFDLTRVRWSARAPWAAAAHAYVDAWRLRSAAGVSVERAAEIGAWVAGLTREHGVGLLVVEVPRSGAYRERRRRQESQGDLTAEALAKMNRAIGAVAHAARCAGARLAELSPVDSDVERQTGLLSQAMAQATALDRTLGRDLVLMGSESIYGKKCRHRILASLLGAAGGVLPKQEDARDAAWLGVQYIAMELSR